MIGEADSLDHIQALARANLSLSARIRYVCLLLVSGAMTSVVISLWITEHALPWRTRAAFAVMASIGASWCALAIWVLRARRPLFARDRVIAGTMALGFTSMFAAVALAVAVLQGGAAAYVALASGVVMLAAAGAVFTNARRQFARLAGRRRELERALAN